MSAESLEQRILGYSHTAIVLLTGSPLRLGFLNNAAETLFNVSSHRVIGKPLSEVITGDELQAQFQLHRQTGQSSVLRGIRLRFASDNEIHQLDCYLGVIGKKECPQLLLEFPRVSPASKITRENKQQDQVAVSQALLRGLAHEIKNPLGGLRGAAQLLERELKREEQLEYTGVIIKEADRLRSLVDRMMVPWQPPEMVSLNVHEVLEHVVLLVQTEFQEGVEVKRDYDPSLPNIKGDKGQLIQAVLNVARNAVQAMGSEGKITLRSRIERNITINRQVYRQVLRVDVEDHGPGIDTEIAEQIFYPMVSSKTDGTGLGLSITQDIIARHNGLIEWDAQKPDLTRFSIYLPVEIDRG